MERKFDKSRLFKLIKIVVNVLTVILLLLSVNSFRSFYVLNHNFTECMNIQLGTWDEHTIIPTECEDYVHYYYPLFKGFEYLALGIALPVIFYSGVGVYNYIFPIVNKQ